MPAVVWKFSESGAGRVLDVFESIDQRALKSARSAKQWETTTTKAANTNARELVKSEKEVAKAQRDAAKETRYAQDQLAKQRERQTKTASAAQRKADKETQYAAEQLAKRKERIAKDETKQQSAQVKETERWRKMAHASQLQRMAEEKRANDKYESKRSRVIGRVGSGLLGAAGMAVGAGTAGAAATMALGGAALRHVMETAELASKVSVQGRQAGEQAVDPRLLRREWENAAIAAPGATAMGVGGAVQTMVSRTGELGVARSWEKEIATIIAATDVEGSALGDTLSTMMQKFDIKKVDDMKDAMAGMIMQGKKGAFELQDAAMYMGEVGAAAERFGGSMKGAKGLKTLGGMMQIARQSTGSGAEASTAVETMFRQLVSASKEIKTKTGVEVFKDKNKTQTNDFLTLIPKIIAGAKGNQATLAGIFDVRGIRAVSPLISEFNKVTTAGGSVAAGMAAVSAMMNDAIEAGGKWTDVQEDAALRGESAHAKLSSAWESLSSTIGGAMEPAFADLVTELANMVKRDDVQLALVKLGELIAGAGVGLIAAFDWIVDKLLATGVITQAEIDARKAEKASGKAAKELKEGVTPEQQGQIKELLGQYGPQGTMGRANPEQLQRIMESENLGPQWKLWQDAGETRAEFNRTQDDRAAEVNLQSRIDKTQQQITQYGDARINAWVPMTVKAGEQEGLAAPQDQYNPNGLQVAQSGGIRAAGEKAALAAASISDLHAAAALAAKVLADIGAPSIFGGLR